MTLVVSTCGMMRQPSLGAPNRRLNVGQFGQNSTTVLAKLHVLL